LKKNIFNFSEKYFKLINSLFPTFYLLYKFIRMRKLIFMPFKEEAAG